MRPTELRELVTTVRLSGTDTSSIEVKSAAAGVGKSLWPTLSAFSNTRGGVVVLGLDEATGFEPATGFDARKVMNQIADVARPRGGNEPSGPLSPSPVMTVEQMEIDGSPVVVVEVDELPAAEKPCFVTAQGKERGTYMRVGDGDHRLDTYSVFQLSVLTIPSNDDREPVIKARIDDLDADLIRRTVSRLRSNRPRALDGADSERQVLERIGVIDRDSGCPTLGGVLALGSFPQQFFPQLMISFASYPGAQKDVVLGDERMVDRAVLEGSIPDMIDDAVTAVTRNLRVRRVSKGAGASDLPEIPIDAIREAITNAVTHRDYSEMARGDQVRVELYPDRLEVHSPGGLWGGRGIDSIFDGESRSRNQVLARLLTEVPFTNRDETVGENAGSGIPRMLGEMTQNGLPAPRFHSTPASFVTVLDRFGLLNPETRDWLDSIGGRRTNTGDNALALIHHLGSVTVDDLRRQLAIDTSVAQQTLDDLVAEGIVEHKQGEFQLAAIRSADPQLNPTQRRVIDELSDGSTLTVHELADRLAIPVNTLRPALRALVNDGRVSATAPPSSRRRAYRI
ncbi:ATP-binding protein [Gordonia polyisoprenivorans]|uniref:ATP-binding protein n=1 Tax=Gordonia polyisoprenivorans TaxID=84595 RepID=UPI0003A1745B|nr:ATP-binding protein [Gordonia polyisoprenivorans]